MLTANPDAEPSSADQPTVAVVHARFCGVFGPPHQTLGNDFHWALRRTEDALPINVLMNGTIDVAAIWIFDPVIDRFQAVFKMFIHHPAQIDEVIKQVNDRMDRANTTSREYKSAAFPHPSAAAESSAAPAPFGPSELNV